MSKRRFVFGIQFYYDRLALAKTVREVDVWRKVIREMERSK